MSGATHSRRGSFARLHSAGCKPAIQESTRFGVRMCFRAMVRMARCAVPARVVAGGTNIQATLAIEGVAPLHAARTSQRDVSTGHDQRFPKMTVTQICSSTVGKRAGLFATLAIGLICLGQDTAGGVEAWTG